MLLLAPLRDTVALSIEPQITINMLTIPEEMRDRFHEFEQRLEEYVGEHDWDEEDERLTLYVPIAIQVQNAADATGIIECRGTFACNNSGDINIQDNEWIFRYDEFRDFSHQRNNFDSLLGMVDFHMHLIIGYELDKLGEMAGNAHFELAAQIGNRAKFSELNQGWDKRMEDLGKLMTPDYESYRRLRWVTHTSMYYKEVLENDYEAWVSAVTALKLAEQIDDPTLLQNFWRVNYRHLGMIFVRAADRDNLNLIRRLDRTDPTRMDWYQERLTEIDG